MKLKTLLSEEIQDEFENLSKMELGTESYKVTVDGLAKLMDRKIEIEKFEAEREDKLKAQEIENEFKAQQMEDEKKDRRIRNILTAAGIGIPAGITVWGTLKSLKFEVDGTVTTLIGRSHIGNITKLFKR